MSIQGNYAGNVIQPVNVNLAGTSLTDIGSAASKTPTIISSFAIANTTGVGVDCSIYWFEASTATDFLVWFKTVAAKDTAVISDVPIRLREGDKIKAIGAANVRVTLFPLELIPLNRPTI